MYISLSCHLFLEKVLILHYQMHFFQLMFFILIIGIQVNNFFFYFLALFGNVEKCLLLAPSKANCQMWISKYHILSDQHLPKFSSELFLFEELDVPA